MSNEFQKIAYRHPLATAAGSAVLMLSISLGAYRLELPWALGLSATFGGAIYLLWRNGGWARKRAVIDDSPVHLPRVAILVGITLAAAALTMGAIALSR